MVQVRIVRRRGRFFYRVYCRVHGWVSPVWNGRGRDVITPALVRHERLHA